MLRNGQLLGGLNMFFFQFLLQAGLFFTIPLYLSVALGLSAIQTGVRLLRCRSLCCSPPSVCPDFGHRPRRAES